MVTFIVIVVGISFEAAMCRLLFGVYALPCVVGFLAAFAAYNTGAGEFGTFIVGLVAGALTLGIGQLIFRNAQSRVIRTVVALLFGIPAALAGPAVDVQTGRPSLLEALPGPSGPPRGKGHTVFAPSRLQSTYGAGSIPVFRMVAVASGAVRYFSSARGASAAPGRVSACAESPSSLIVLCKGRRRASSFFYYITQVVAGFSRRFSQYGLD
jgi:hypothetical protein